MSRVETVMKSVPVISVAVVGMASSWWVGARTCRSCRHILYSGVCAFSHAVGRHCPSEALISFSPQRHQTPKGGAVMAQGYCVKERKKVEIQNPQQVTMKNGRPAIQGVCPDCGTKIFKIGKLS